MASTRTVPASRLTLAEVRCPACGRLLMQARLLGASRVEIRCKRRKATVEVRGARVRLAGSGQQLDRAGAG